MLSFYKNKHFFYFRTYILHMYTTVHRSLRVHRITFTSSLNGKAVCEALPRIRLSWSRNRQIHNNNNTWLAMLVMNDLTSMDVGQDSWHGACAHLRQRRASRTAARSPSRSVVGLTSVHHRFHSPPAHPSTVPAVSCVKIKIFLFLIIIISFSFFFYFIIFQHEKLIINWGKFYFSESLMNRLNIVWKKINNCSSCDAYGFKGTRLYSITHPYTRSTYPKTYYCLTPTQLILFIYRLPVPIDSYVSCRFIV